MDHIDTCRISEVVSHREDGLESVTVKFEHRVVSVKVNNSSQEDYIQGPKTLEVIVLSTLT